MPTARRGRRFARRERRDRQRDPVHRVGQARAGPGRGVERPFGRHRAGSRDGVRGGAVGIEPELVGADPDDVGPGQHVLPIRLPFTWVPFTLRSSSTYPSGVAWISA